ncbi:SHOCT domain-containing protein [Streptacidiphilus rugosus]|uniref:SHOCT domain-containing protein n=1 Tax=Streptacidiphilus rugosus TaxID=405783 RepID=UPI000569E382|nr:SHOCT domain-containing protein [Streptacidiphilus rugosus]
MIGRRVGRGGRPGLIGTAARTAVVAGTATAVSGRVAARHQQAAAASQPPVAPPPPAAQAPAETAAAPAPGALDDQALANLERLGALHQQGMLTDEEFAQAKQRILTT